VRVRAAPIVVALVAMLVAPSVAMAHVTLQPPEWEAGGFARFVVRVPNERDDAATTEVTVRFPEQVIEARVQPTPGWEYEVQMAQLDEPIEEEGEEPITEKVDTITWRGGRIRPGEFQEFGVSFQMPEEAPGTMIAFPSIQTYDSGEVVRWIGPEESDEPAPLVETLEAPPEGEEAAATPTPAPAAQTEGGGAAAEEEGGGSDTLSIIALIVGAIGLIVGIVALMRRGGGGRPEPTTAREERKEEVGVS
jgi:periplasmic copper chaperone A